MRTKQSATPIIIAVIALVLVVVLGVLIWLFAANVIVGGHIYPKNALFLNLRGKELTFEDYDKLRENLPDCDIYWDIPFQGKTYHENTNMLKVTNLSDADVDAIGYFENLEVVNAMECRDYAQIEAVKSRYPDVAVGYVVYVNDVPYASDATEVVVTALTEEEISLLQYLPNLKAVDLGGCEDYTLLDNLMQTYPQVSVTVNMGDDKYTNDATELTVTGMTDTEAKSLAFFSDLTKLHMVNPVMDPQVLLGLCETYPNVAITWEMDVMGVTLRSGDTEVDLMEGISKEGAKAYEMAASTYVHGDRDEKVMLFAKNSKYPVPDYTQKTAELISQVEQALAYFPDVKYVSMRGAFLDNEAMAAFREAHRADYKVVWTVNCGSMVVSTDTTYFMPYKYGVSYFFDEDAYNLRYCEDTICVDVGHMSVHNCEWAGYMPNLKYLILAHTQVSDLSGIENCKNLLFLELDWSIVKDFTPLLGCTALEDLNISKTFADIEPILQMDWLKHLWATERGEATQYKLNQAFGVIEEETEGDAEADGETEPAEPEEPKTMLYLNGDFTTGGIWRQLPNYYAMREVLGMPAMN